MQSERSSADLSAHHVFSALADIFWKNKEVIQPHVPVRLPCLSESETIVISMPASVLKVCTHSVVIPGKGMLHA
jgi:hypothetical protein